MPVMMAAVPGLAVPGLSIPGNPSDTVPPPPGPLLALTFRFGIPEGSWVFSAPALAWQFSAPRLYG